MSADSNPDISNSDLFLYVLYRMGGAGKYVDVEDVFIEMWNLAPERFSWRKYAYPHYKIAHDALSDVTKPRKGQADLLLRTDDGLARQLTAKGVHWVESRLSLFESFASGKLKAPPDRRPSQRTLAGLERDSAVRDFLAGRGVDLTRQGVAIMLRCSPDSAPSVWRERWESLKSAAADAHRTDLLRFLDWLEEARPEWFGGS